MLMGDTFTTAMKTCYSNLNAEVVNLMHGDSSQIILGCVFSFLFFFVFVHVPLEIN